MMIFLLQLVITKPDIKISVKQTFGIDSDMQIDAFSKKQEHVPKVGRPRVNESWS